MAIGLAAGIAGRKAVTVNCRIERRWAMNFAAAVGDSSPCYYGDDGRPLMVHPMYQAQLEWRIRKLLMPDSAVPREVRARAVHSSQYQRSDRLLCVGEMIIMRAAIVGAEPGRSGARLTTRFDAFDRGGTRFSTAIASTVFRGVELSGEAVIPPTIQPADSVKSLPPFRRRQDSLELTRAAAHIYGECARIWNPIHSDMVTARRVGLPGRIMHGSGLLAMAVSNVIRHEGSGDPSVIRLITARFREPVILPSRPSVHVSVTSPHLKKQEVCFQVIREDGVIAMEGHCLIMGSNQRDVVPNARAGL